MKTKFIVALVALSFCTSNFAAPPSAASVERLFEATRLKSVIDDMRNEMDKRTKETMKLSLAHERVSPKEQKVLDEYVEKMAALLHETLNWEKFKPLYTQVYLESFTQEEIDGLLAFYESPAGRAYINKMPGVMKKTMDIAYERMIPLQREAQALTQDFAQRISLLQGEERSGAKQQASP